MQTLMKLGPADHSRPLSREEFRTAQWQTGYKYELINGRLHVSPAPNFPHDRLVTWLYRQLDRYASLRPDVVNYVASRPRVPLPHRPEATEPEPDIAAFQDVPLHLPTREIRWELLSPILVAEVISEDDPAKDLIRNPVLYLEVPSIREYWVIDPRPDPDEPTLFVYRRRGARWQLRITVPFGGVYTTRLLPGFSLTVDPRQ